MTDAATARGLVVPPRTDPLWFLGTMPRVKLDGDQTGGRFALVDWIAPRGAAPPLHSHPQDETLYLIDGELTAWVVDPPPDGDGQLDPATWVSQHAQRCTPGSVVYAPSGVPHTFRVESDTVHAVILSTPAGIEDYMRALAEPARWPWLQPPADGPRVPLERITEVEQRLGVVRHGPPPPPAA